MLRGEAPVHLRQVRAKLSLGKAGRGRRASAAAGIDADAEVDADLLARLKAWRLAQARDQGLPAYVILHDATLLELARRRPGSTDALSTVPGIGAKKLERYGQALLDVVAGVENSPVDE